MYLYWVIIYPLCIKIPFKTKVEADRVYNLACIYHPHEIDIICPDFLQ